MLNKIWFWLLFLGILVGGVKGAYYSFKGELPPRLRAAETAAAGVEADGVAGQAEGQVAKTYTAAEVMQASGEQLTTDALDAARLAVELCITLVGVMTLWLGLMNIAKDAGLVDGLARLMRPVMRWLFPDVPDGHAAQGSMLMNIAANMLGMGNAATPFGLKAMNDLQTLNTRRETCTDAMSMFLAINTSSVTIIPITLIGIRIGTGSGSPAAPMFGLLIATSISTATAIITTKLFSRFPKYSLENYPLDESVKEIADSDGEGV